MKNNEFYIQLSREDNFLEVDIVKPNVEENIEKVEDQVLQQADESNVKDSIFQEVQLFKKRSMRTRWNCLLKLRRLMKRSC